MSAVAERVKENRKRLSENLASDLETKKLSRLLRRETWTDHERAEYSPFEVALVRGTVPREAYLDLLAQVYPVYIALEERAAELRDDPVAGRVYFPELNRTENIEADLEFYGGPNWRDSIELLDVSKEYVQRIREATPVQFVAHHYNRYLADLSGGLMICDALKEAWDLDGDGVRYYDFAGIPDANEFKKNYRRVLDDLPLSTEEKLDLIEEVMLAYEFNIEMVRTLGERHDVKAPVGAGAPHRH